MNTINNLRATAQLAAVPLGMCAYKTAADIALKLVPRRVSTPIKIAYKVGSVGIGMIADHLVASSLTSAVDGVEAVMEARELKKESKKANVVNIKEEGA